jgi:hypothetical protein
MSAPIQTQSEAKETYQRVFQLKEEFAMMLPMATKNLKMWITENLGTRLGSKLLRGLALGALLVAATLLYISMIQGEARSPSASSETTWALQAPVYMGPEDPEVAEMPYDDLLKSFIGVPASGNEAIEVTHTDKLPEIFEEDANERVYDELMKSFVGIPAPRSEATDRFLPGGED